MKSGGMKASLSVNYPVAVKNDGAKPFRAKSALPQAFFVVLTSGSFLYCCCPHAWQSPIAASGEEAASKGG
jgi:hypothetical protein